MEETTRNSPISVIVTDDNPFFLKQMCDLLNDDQRIRVQAVFRDLGSMVSHFEEIEASVAILDLDLANSLEIMKMKQVNPSLKIIGIGLLNQTYENAAWNLGYDLYLDKFEVSLTLIPTIIAL